MKTDGSVEREISPTVVVLAVGSNVSQILFLGFPESEIEDLCEEVQEEAEMEVRIIGHDGGAIGCQLNVHSERALAICKELGVYDRLFDALEVS